LKQVVFMTKNPIGDGQASEKLTNKAEAVRRALGELGAKALPTEIQEFIKTRFEIEMSTKVISVYKSKLAKQKGRRGRKPSLKHSLTPAGVLHSISIRDLRTIKDLKDRHGPARLRELLELVSL
jgi:hypothetical protein